MKKLCLLLLYTSVAFSEELEKKQDKFKECIEKDTAIEDCFSLGSDFYQRQDYENAEKYFSIACKFNHAMACGNLGLIYHYSDKKIII